MKTGLEIFELSVIPFILYNSEVWDSIPVEGVQMLEKIQLTFLRMVLKTPKSTPIQSLLWETGSLDIVSKINIRNLNFYHHIINLEDDDIAKKIAQIQMKNKFPDLMMECQQLLRKYEIDDLIVTEYTKYSWKRIVKKAVVKKATDQIIDKMKNYKKVNFKEKQEEDFKIKDYLETLNLMNARTEFAMKTNMLKHIRFNYMSNPKY